MSVYQRSLTLTLVTLLPVACGGAKTKVVATTPTAIEICASPQGRQEVLTQAEAHCAGRGLVAQLTGQAGECFLGDVFASANPTISHFRCGAAR